MTTRWWTPSGPHIGPDEVDLALLKPGGEDRYDLGAALFALHRTGAAACEAVAASPIPDEARLVSSLAIARQGLANPLVESISKSLHNPVYSGLLVRDVFDDAEEGALELYRAAVSKGVPPAVAVTRAGMIFGVPSAQMGNFRNLACDIRTHPATLQDAADRALFAAVEKICTEEVTEAVSKAPVDTPDDPNTPYWDARSGQSGRFMPKTKSAMALQLDQLLQQASQREAEPATEERVETPKPQVRRTPRVKRVRRAPKAEPKPASSQLLSQARQAAQAKARQKAQEVARRMGRSVARIKQPEILPAAVEDRLSQVNKPRPGKSLIAADFTRPLPEVEGPWDQHNKEMVFVLGPEDYQRFASGAKEINMSQLVFRVGHLAKLLTEGPHEMGSDALEDAILGEAKFQHRQSVLTPPETAVVWDEDFPRGPKHDEAIKNSKEDLVDNWLVGNSQSGDSQADFDREAELELEKIVTRRTPDDRGTVLVYEHEGTGIFAVNEFAVEKGVLRMRWEGSPAQGEWVVDPNQILKVTNTAPERVYDPVKQIWRNRYYLAPSFDVEKAVSTPDDPSTPYWDARQPSGQFAPANRPVQTDEKYEVLPEYIKAQLEAYQETKEPLTPARPKQTKRVNRVRRAIRTPDPKVTSSARGELQSQARTKAQRLSRAQQQMIQRAFSGPKFNVKPIEPEPKPTPATSKPSQPKPNLLPQIEELPEGIYTVMTEDEFTALLDSAGYSPQWRDVRSYPSSFVIHPSTAADELFTSENTMEADQALTAVMDITQSHIRTQMYGAPFKPMHEESIFLDPDDPKSPARLRSMAERIFHNYANITELRIVPDLEDTERIFIMGNKDRVPPVMVVDYDPSWNPDDETEIVHIGTYRYSDFEAERDIDPTTATYARPTVVHYKLIGPTIDRWQIRNVDRPLGRPRRR